MTESTLTSHWYAGEAHNFQLNIPMDKIIRIFEHLGVLQTFFSSCLMQSKSRHDSHSSGLPNAHKPGSIRYLSAGLPVWYKKRLSGPEPVTTLPNLNTA